MKRRISEFIKRDFKWWPVCIFNHFVVAILRTKQNPVWLSFKQLKNDLHKNVSQNFIQMLCNLNNLNIFASSSIPPFRKQRLAKFRSNIHMRKYTYKAETRNLYKNIETYSRDLKRYIHSDMRSVSWKTSPSQVLRIKSREKIFSVLRRITFSDPKTELANFDSVIMIALRVIVIVLSVVQIKASKLKKIQ